MRCCRDIRVGKSVHFPMLFLVLITVMLAFVPLLAIMIIVDVQYRAGGDLVILQLSIVITVSKIQATQVTAQRKINCLTVVNRLCFCTQ